ncbi:MAG: hypothetical protein ABSF61_08265 [Anaerolineales bacterium]
MKASPKMAPVLGMLVGSAALILTACGGAGTSSKGTEVDVTLQDYSITSSATSFQVGVPYDFVVSNKGALTHQLDIMPPTGVGPVSEQDVQKELVAGIDRSGIDPGKTVRFQYTFTKAYPQGQLEMACHLEGHYEAGMHLSITVQ